MEEKFNRDISLRSDSLRMEGARASRFNYSESKMGSTGGMVLGNSERKMIALAQEFPI